MGGCGRWKKTTSNTCGRLARRTKYCSALQGAAQNTLAFHVRAPCKAPLQKVTKSCLLFYVNSRLRPVVMPLVAKKNDFDTPSRPALLGHTSLTTRGERRPERAVLGCASGSFCRCSYSPLTLFVITLFVKITENHYKN